MARIAPTFHIGAIVLVLAVAAAAAVGCGGQETTGAHVYVRLGSLQYDELRLGVTRTATGEVVVDPAAAGRYPGPFQPGDQDAFIYLPDALDGSAGAVRRDRARRRARRSAPAPPTCWSRAA